MSEKWSIPTWTFFHTLAEKINNTFYINNTGTILSLIKKICSNLPCPECRAHASLYINRIRIDNVKTKEDFRMMLFTFHNSVNSRLRKPMFKKENLIKYKNGRLDVIFSLFISGFIHTYAKTLYAGNLSQEGTRKVVGKQISIWCKANWKHLQGF